MRASATCPLCGGSNAPPKRPGHVPLEHLVADLDLLAPADAGGPQRRLELARIGRRRAGHAVAALGARGRGRRGGRAAAGGRRGSRRAPRAAPPAAAAAPPGTARTARPSARRSPRPVAVEVRSTRRIRSSATVNGGGSGVRSSLFSTTIWRRCSRPAPYSSSSRSTSRKRSSASPSDASITCTSRRARSRCARNSWPRPTPSLAPSISPGTSATVSCRSRPRASTVPSTGWSVVNGYAATFGVAFEIRRRSDDFPAFGSPTSAASASSFRRSSSSASSPGSPVSAKRGVWRVGGGEAGVPAPGRRRPARARRAGRARRGRRAARPRPPSRPGSRPARRGRRPSPFAPCRRFAAAVPAAPAADDRLRAERREVAEVRVRDEHDVAARRRRRRRPARPWGRTSRAGSSARRRRRARRPRGCSRGRGTSRGDG